MSIKIEGVVTLPREDSGLQHSIVRFNNRHIDAKRVDLNRFFRRSPVIIVNLKTGTKILRYAMGNSGNISIGKNSIALDYDAVDALGIKFREPVDLEVRRAKRWEVWQWFLNYPDLSIQLSVRLGIGGAILGMLGFLTGIIPLIFG